MREKEKTKTSLRYQNNFELAAHCLSDGRKRYTMTNRDFYTAIINADLTAILEDEMAKSVKEHAKAALGKLDETNEKRRNAPSKKELENLPLMEQVVNEVLSFEPMTASDIGAAIGVNHTKATHIVKMAVTRGLAGVKDIKVPKKGMQKGYFLLGGEDENSADAE